MKLIRLIRQKQKNNKYFVITLIEITFWDEQLHTVYELLKLIHMLKYTEALIANTSKHFWVVHPYMP